MINFTPYYVANNVVLSIECDGSIPIVKNSVQNLFSDKGASMMDAISFYGKQNPSKNIVVRIEGEVVPVYKRKKEVNYLEASDRSRYSHFEYGYNFIITDEVQHYEITNGSAKILSIFINETETPFKQIAIWKNRYLLNKAVGKMQSELTALGCTTDTIVSVSSWNYHKKRRDAFLKQNISVKEFLKEYKDYLKSFPPSELRWKIPNDPVVDINGECFFVNVMYSLDD